MTELLSYLAIGVTQGLVYGLLALGIVLVYKGSRALNLAHPFFGLVAAFVCWWLVDKASFFPFTAIPFEAGTRPRAAVAVVLSIAFIALYGFGVEHGIIRRLGRAPRLVVLVATIALAQGALGLVLLLFNRTEEQANEFRTIPAFLNSSFEVGNRVVTGADLQVLIVVPLICVGAALFFTRTRFGVAIRAAAENQEAARLLGIPASRVSVFTWVTGAVLAAIAGILITSVRGSLDISTLSTGFLVRGLAAALVGGLTSLPGAVVGGLAVGVGEAMLQMLTDNRPGVPETLLLGVVIIMLVVRPGGLFGRPEETEDKVAFVPALRELPKRLAGTPSALSTKIAGGLILAFVVAMSAVSGSETNGTLTLVTVFAIAGVGLTVLMGFTGQISLGHWGFVGLGAFTMANLHTELGVPYLLALPITVYVGGLAAMLLGLPALRIRGMYLAVVTLAFNLAAEFFIFKSRLIGGSSAGIPLRAPKLGPLDLDDPSRRPIFLFALAMLGLSVLIARNLARSRTGRGFFAVRENEKAAATLGVGLTGYKLLAFAVSGGIAALAGAVNATYIGNAESTTYATAISLVMISIVMIGGLGSLSGPLLGAFVVIGLPRLLEFENRWIIPIGTGILLLIVIVRLPGGIAGLLQSIRLRIVSSVEDIAAAEPAAVAPTGTAPSAAESTAPA